MKKLEQGDYVKDLTEQQFNELQDIEGCFYRVLWSSNTLEGDDFITESVMFDRGALVHSIKEDVTNLLSFDEFKERLINTK